MSVLGVVPARFGATRFPGKILHSIAGRPLLAWVLDRAKLAAGMSAGLVVATDDARIAHCAEHMCGVRAVMTRADHASGTDRVAEVMARPEFAGVDAAVNIQGDEIGVCPRLIDRLADAIASAVHEPSHAQIVTAAEESPPLLPDEAHALLAAPSLVKVVLDERDCALYFSRSLVPYLRDDGSAAEPHTFFRHVGIYAYTRHALARLVAGEPTPLERAERLEQLRALQRGLAIRVLRVPHGGASSVAVDVPADVARAEAFLVRRP